MELLVKNGLVVTMDGERRVLRNASIAVDGGRIVEIGREVKGKADVVIDAGRKIVLPGLINAHTHLPMTLFRGVADDVPLDRWLREEIWPVEAKLEGRHIYAGALLGCLEMIRSGTTCFNDMYFFMDEVARAVEESGIRGVLSHAMLDLGDGEKARRFLREGEELMRRHRQDGRVRIFLGPHAPYTCSEELLIKTKELSDKYKTGVHIHVAETKAEVEDSVKAHGKSPFEYLDSIGFLGPRVVAAHSVWASDQEVEIMAERGVKVAHNPVCNMKIASGVARVPDYLERGITVALGTDGPASNNSLELFDDMKICALVHKLRSMDASAVPAEKVLEFATINGAKALGMEAEIGSLEAGKRADIILLDIDRPNLVPLTNPVSHVVYAARGCDVSTVIVDGRVVMEDRQLRTLDQGQVLAFAREEARDLFTKAGREDRLFDL
ncbi:MAG: amidohydrolase family protein [Euryarchaeota archaeon]|nr:amidohydrolase family protein [Euryarchaeota archaeon]